MSRRLLVTSTELMMLHFLVPHINFLYQQGFQITLACSDVSGRLEEVRHKLNVNIPVYKINLSRNPLKLKNIIGYSELLQMFEQENYDCIWTNEPVMGVMTRLAARRRKHGIVLYMVHGYHFYRRAPILNWLAYPVEWFMAHFTDVTVTINWEDYNRTKKAFCVKYVEHIDGVGIDLNRFRPELEIKEKRTNIHPGIQKDDILIVSVGELQKRKNHEPIIRAIAKLANSKIKYIVCGEGELMPYLTTLVKKLNLQNQVFFLGYRTDIEEILQISDIFAFPSLREGMGIAALEAMASGLPLVTSNIQGIPDYVIDEKNGYCCNPGDVNCYALSINKLISDVNLRNKMGKYNMDAVKKYDISIISKQILKIINHYAFQQEN